MLDHRHAAADFLVGQLAHLGVNVAKPHPVEHLFFFAKPDRADMAAAALRAEGFAASASSEPRQGLWTVIARGQMVLSVESMWKSSTRMERLADEYVGSYDGWGIPLSKT